MATWRSTCRSAGACRRGPGPRLSRRHVQPTVFGMVDAHRRAPSRPQGIRAITRPDQRWGRCDIKSTALLANVLARQAASEAGAGEALLIRDGQLSEGSASSVIIVEHGGAGAPARRPRSAARHDDGRRVRHRPPVRAQLPSTNAISEDRAAQGRRDLDLQLPPASIVPVVRAGRPARGQRRARAGLAQVAAAFDASKHDAGAMNDESPRVPLQLPG